MFGHQLQRLLRVRGHHGSEAGAGEGVLSPSSLTLNEGDTATYRVKLSASPSQPIQVGIFWADPDGLLSEALAGYQNMVLLPSNYAVPEGSPLEGWSWPWNVGVPVVVEALENDTATGDATVLIEHEVWTTPADWLDDPESWAEDPVYHFISGPSMKVTVLDDDD